MDTQWDEFRRQWRALLGCTVAGAIGTVGFYAFTSGAFVAPLMAAGYTRSQLSLGSLLISGVVAMFAPFAGQIMDRYGALRLVTLSVIGEAIGFALLASAPVQFQYFAGALILLAVLGVGTTPPGFARIVSARFDLARGVALGITISGPGLIAMTAPLWLTAVIEHGGWRAGYWLMSVMVLTLGGAGVLLIGSGGAKTARAGSKPVKADVVKENVVKDRGNWSALRKPMFWLLMTAFLAPALVSSGYLFHMITLLRQRGYSAEEAAGVQSLIGVAIVFGRLTSGAAIDRFPAQRVAAAIFMLSALGGALLLTDDPTLAGVAALGIGLTIGSEQDLMAYLFGRHFGLESFGRIYGLAYSGLIISAGASPLLISKLADLSGYHLAFIVSICGTLAAALLLLALPPAPQPKLPNPAERLASEASVGR